MSVGCCADHPYPRIVTLLLDCLPVFVPPLAMQRSANLIRPAPSVAEIDCVNGRIEQPDAQVAKSSEHLYLPLEPFLPRGSRIDLRLLPRVSDPPEQIPVLPCASSFEAVIRIHHQ